MGLLKEEVTAAWVSSILPVPTWRDNEGIGVSNAGPPSINLTYCPFFCFQPESRFVRRAMQVSLQLMLDYNVPLTALSSAAAFQVCSSPQHCNVTRKMLDIATVSQTPIPQTDCRFLGPVVEGLTH